MSHWISIQKGQTLNGALICMSYHRNLPRANAISSASLSLSLSHLFISLAFVVYARLHGLRFWINADTLKLHASLKRSHSHNFKSQCKLVGPQLRIFASDVLIWFHSVVLNDNVAWVQHQTLTMFKLNSSTQLKWTNKNKQSRQKRREKTVIYSEKTVTSWTNINGETKVKSIWCLLAKIVELKRVFYSFSLSRIERNREN